jgi:hypothetical protein
VTEVAQAQISEDYGKRSETGDGTGVLAGVTSSPEVDSDSTVAQPPVGTAGRQGLPRRFHASVTPPQPLLKVQRKE